MADPVQGQSATASTGVDGAPNPSPQSPATDPTPPASGWFDSLPDGLRAEPSLQSFKDKDPAALAESFVHAQRLVGGSIRIPGKDAKPEDLTKFQQTLRTHLGVPDKVEGYKVERPAELPDGVEWHQDKVQDFLKFAHEIGLSQAQVEKLIARDAQQVAASVGNPIEQARACYDALRNGDDDHPGFGAAVDAKLAIAKRTIEVMGGGAMLEKLQQNGMANDPDFVRMIVKIGQELVEDGIVVPEEKITTAQELTAQLEGIMGDPKNPYWLKDHPDHSKMVQRVYQINQQLYNR